MYFQILIRSCHEIPLLMYEKCNEISYLYKCPQYLQPESETLPTDSMVYGGLSPVSCDESSKNARKQSIYLEAESRVVLFICVFVYVFPAKLLYSSFRHVFRVIKKSFLPPFYGPQSFISVFQNL
jgi:hypothetical protein